MPLYACKGASLFLEGGLCHVYTCKGGIIISGKGTMPLYICKGASLFLKGGLCYVYAYKGSERKSGML